MHVEEEDAVIVQGVLNDAVSMEVSNATGNILKKHVVLGLGSDAVLLILFGVNVLFQFTDAFAENESVDTSFVKLLEKFTEVVGSEVASSLSSNGNVDRSCQWPHVEVGEIAEDYTPDLVSVAS